MILYRTPGRSFTRPPRTSTMECSCRLCPTPGMYAVTSIWFVRRTRATFRSAEFGFLGVVVKTRVQTPRFCGEPPSAGVFVFPFGTARPFLTSWLTVGIEAGRFSSLHAKGRRGGRPTNRTADGTRGENPRQTAVRPEIPHE